MQNSEVDLKREGFRTEIRRKHLNGLFASERLKLFEQAITAEHEEVMGLLDSNERRAQWVNSLAVGLVEHPRAEWGPVLRQLSLGVRAFEENFELWLHTGIIRALTQLLKQDWLHLGLTKLAVNILTDVFYQLPSFSEQINEILNYEFFLDLIELCCGLEDATEYYQLMNTMIDDRPSLRDKLIKNGVIQILSKKLKEYTLLNSD